MFSSTIVIDNITKGDLLSEWGLSIYIEYNGKKILLDTGATDKFADNAKMLGIDLADIDVSVLSHAHYDHSGGYDRFFSENDRAILYVSENCDDKCVGKKRFFWHYDGIPKGLLTRHASRIVYAKGLTPLKDASGEVIEGAWIVPHIGGNLAEIGRKAKLGRRRGLRVIPDDFSHEQSLVFETERGLVVLNSCTHSGLENVVADLKCYMPGKHIYMTIGGLHLYRYSEEEVRKIAHTIKDLNIERVITGHCTGKPAFDILAEELGDKVEQTYSGLIVK